MPVDGQPPQAVERRISRTGGRGSAGVATAATRTLAPAAKTQSGPRSTPRLSRIAVAIRAVCRSARRVAPIRRRPAEGPSAGRRAPRGTDRSCGVLRPANGRPREPPRHGAALADGSRPGSFRSGQRWAYAGPTTARPSRNGGSEPRPRRPPRAGARGAPRACRAGASGARRGGDPGLRTSDPPSTSRASRSSRGHVARGRRAYCVHKIGRWTNRPRRRLSTSLKMPAAG